VGLVCISISAVTAAYGSALTAGHFWKSREPDQPKVTKNALPHHLAPRLGSVCPGFSCGSEPARESGGSVCGDVGYPQGFWERHGPVARELAPAGARSGPKKAMSAAHSSGSKLAPTGETRSRQEPGRLSGRLVVDVDFGAPLTTMAERRYCAVGNPAWMPG
jgi:hypothetical protein